MAKLTEQEIKSEFIVSRDGIQCAPMDVSVDFEHGQWWVTHLPTGAQWSVNEWAHGLEFEMVSEGEAA